MGKIKKYGDYKNDCVWLKFNGRDALLKELYEDMDPEKEAEKKEKIRKHLNL